MSRILRFSVIAAILVVSVKGWIGKRRLRYKNYEILDFESIKAAAKTGDILLFHKTTRSGWLDAFELDVLSPLLFDQNEFRHSGIIVKKDGELFVMECADEFHSGHSEATYLTRGNGIRLVALEALLSAYNRDNGDPHFGIKHISDEMELAKVYAALEQYGSIDYLKMHKSVAVFLSHVFLPKALHRRIVDGYKQEMMCSEFVHSLLNRCGVLKDYPSKLFAPYYIENSDVFRELEIVKYSDITRFRYSGPPGSAQLPDPVIAG